MAIGKIPYLARARKSKDIYRKLRLQTGEIILLLLLTIKEKGGKLLPFKASVAILSSVKKAEIKLIANYLKDLEEGLYEWDYRGITTQGHLTELYRIIEVLMDETFKARDRQLKILLASLELKARKCKECIELRLAVRN